MKLSTKARYAVRGIFDLVFHGEGGPEQIRKIADRQEIPPRYLEQIFQRLKRAGVLKTQRGAKGGYYLGRHPSEITVADVVRLTDGPLSLVKGWKHGQRNIPAHRATYSAVKRVWEEASRQLEEYLDTLTITDLCHRASLVEQKGRHALFVTKEHEVTPGGIGESIVNYIERLKERIVKLEKEQEVLRTKMSIFSKQKEEFKRLYEEAEQKVEELSQKQPAEHQTIGLPKTIGDSS